MMQTKTTYETGLEQCIRYAWIESLEWVLGVLNDEIVYCKDNHEFYSSPTYGLERMHTIFSSRRKEWMLYEPS